MGITSSWDRRHFLSTLVGASGIALTPGQSAVSSPSNAANVYDRLGVQALINAAGILTMLGGSLMFARLVIEVYA